MVAQAPLPCGHRSVFAQTRHDQALEQRQWRSRRQSVRRGLSLYVCTPHYICHHPPLCLPPLPLRASEHVAPRPPPPAPWEYVERVRPGGGWRSRLGPEKRGGVRRGCTRQSSGRRVPLPVSSAVLERQPPVREREPHRWPPPSLSSIYIEAATAAARRRHSAAASVGGTEGGDGPRVGRGGPRADAARWVAHTSAGRRPAIGRARLTRRGGGGGGGRQRRWRAGTAPRRTPRRNVLWQRREGGTAPGGGGVRPRTPWEGLAAAAPRAGGDHRQRAPPGGTQQRWRYTHLPPALEKTTRGRQMRTTTGSAPPPRQFRRYNGRVSALRSGASPSLA